MDLDFFDIQLKEFEDISKETKNIIIKYLAFSGKRLYHLGEFEKAMEFFYSILRLDYDSVIALNYIALDCARLGNVDVGLRHLDYALEIDRSNDELWNTKGLILQRDGKFKESLDCFDMAIRIKPDECSYYIHKALSLDKLGMDSRKEIESAEKNA
jgi:tetratricopeptide (TPR) repeat protein